jgi:hypothetical protein
VVKEKRLVGRSPEGEGRSYAGAFKPVLARRRVVKNGTRAAE